MSNVTTSTPATLEKPYVVCHMSSSLDGRIDCAMVDKLDHSNNYYDAMAKLNAPARICGKTTAAMHFALPESFKNTSGKQIKDVADHKAFYQAPVDPKYPQGAFSIVLDTKGTLTWENNIADDLPLICVVSEQCFANGLPKIFFGLEWL